MRIKTESFFMAKIQKNCLDKFKHLVPQQNHLIKICDYCLRSRENKSKQSVTSIHSKQLKSDYNYVPFHKRTSLATSIIELLSRLVVIIISEMCVSARERDGGKKKWILDDYR